MKVDYDDGNGALGLSKIKVRWRSDASKIEVRWNYNDENSTLR